MHKNKFIFTLLMVITTLSVISLTACQNNSSDLSLKTKYTFALDTDIFIMYYYDKDEQAADDALTLCKSYELVFSRTNENSELYKLNRTINAADESNIIRTDTDGTVYYGFPVSDELYNILSECITYSNIVIDGKRAFNYSLGSISSIYNFSGNEHNIPTEEQLTQLLAHTDTTCFSLEDNMFVTTDTEIELDLGAIAKGYIADRIKEQMEAAGVESAMINLGGNVLLIGSKPDGSDFKVGIADPKNKNSSITSVQLSDKAVVTSGIYQRYFENDGKIYHHILDPDTGLPVDNGFVSVSVISDNSCQADALSTLLFVLGPDKKEELQELFPEVQFITIDENMTITK